MKVLKALAESLLEQHPDEAARVLESLPEEDALTVLAAAPAALAADASLHMAPHRCATLLSKLERGRAAALLEHLGSEVAANVLRRMKAERRSALLDGLAPGRQRALRAVLRFPPNTAGSVMDSDVMALPQDLTVDEALTHIRRAPEKVRYNLYVVDREQVLVGVLNLRELLLARRKDLLRSIMKKDVLSLRADADRHAVLTHPAWRNARSVPVVDESGVYLGAVRYQALRRMEEELRAGMPQDGAPTVEALGELFATGIAGVFGALASSVARPTGGRER